MRRVHGTKTQGCEIVSGVFGLLLRGPRPAPLRVRRLQEAQAGVGLQKTPGDHLWATRQAAGGVLSHGQAVYLLPVSDRRAQGARHGAGRGGNTGEAGKQTVWNAT